MPASMMASVAAPDDVAACAPNASSSIWALVPLATTASAVSLTTMRRRKARSSVLRKSGMARDYITRRRVIIRIRAHGLRGHRHDSRRHDRMVDRRGALYDGCGDAAPRRAER